MGRDHFRDELIGYCETFSSAASPLKNIMMVGGITQVCLRPEATEIERLELLTDMDAGHLEQTLYMLHENRISVSPDFTVAIVNIHPAYGGRDFLTETTQTDLVIMAWVNNGAILSHKSSPLCDLRGVWHQSAVRVGAKAISVISYDSSEIGPYQFYPYHPQGQFEFVADDRRKMMSLLKRRDFHP